MSRARREARAENLAARLRKFGPAIFSESNSTDLLSISTPTMNVPRFSNPHLRTEQLETVSRLDLLDSDAESSSSANRADIEELDALVKRSLGDFAVSEPPRKKRKKRYSQRDSGSNEELVCMSCALMPELSVTTQARVLVAFRLLSSAPVREYNLAPKPHPEIKYG